MTDQSSDPQDHYQTMHSQFGWQVPKHFNIAEVCSRRWAAEPYANMRTAIVEHHGAYEYADHSYATLQKAANKLSHLLTQRGVKRGDRVAIVLPQRFETAVAYMAIFQMGAVAMPLSMLFGAEALEFRLTDSGAVAAIGDEQTIANLLAVRMSCPALHTTVGVGFAEYTADVGYTKGIEPMPEQFDCVRTLAEDAAILIYTSGTTGQPKGALIPHRALIGNLTGFVCSQNWFGFDPEDTSKDSAKESQAIFWSPADWAWTGGLMDALLPTLYFGRPIIAYSGRFSPETAFEILQTYCVTHSFLFPTALKAMMKAFPNPRKMFNLRLQGLMSAGEAVGDAVFAYCKDELGVTVNEMFGQTEINYIVGNCAMQADALRDPFARPSAEPLANPVVGWPARAGSMGRAYPGHRVAVIDEDGKPCKTGELGDVAVHKLDSHGKPDPIFFLGYWNNDAATKAKSTKDGWCRTGDMAICDADGYFWYQGRSDDMFKAAGYRIGPSEIENCLVKHKAVANAAVVPKPDAERGAVVKAYIVLSKNYKPSHKLVKTLQAHVRSMLAPYEYPKDIEFIDALPMTTTGKVQRRVLRLQEETRAAKKSV